VKKQVILEQRLLWIQTIYSFHNIESQELSFGVVFQFSRWHINFVETKKTLEKESKCQSIMEAGI
jgi:hypothetical protein